MMQALEKQFLKNGNPLVDNVHQLFARFTQLLRSEIRLTQLPGEVFQVTEAHLITLQTRLQKHYEDEALGTIWNLHLVGIFNQQGAFLHVARPNGVQEIRAWLNDPANKERIQQVTHLDFTYSRLKALPSEIGLFTGLQQLSLSRNKLSSLPESFGNLQALTKLDLRNNQLSSLPESFGNLQALNRLHLSNNQLSSLPESLGNLQALRWLDLEYNQLSSLPDSFGNLSVLTKFYLRNNQLSSLPDSFGNLQALTELDLRNNQLSSLPDSFGNLQALRWLSLSDNQLSSLPDSFGNLQALRWLYLSDNQLSYLPESLGNLQALNQLHLYNNQLSYLPESLGNLQALTYLHLSHNQLSYLPKSLGNLQALTELHLYNNQLSYLPESLGNLQALTGLSLSNNQLSYLPDSFGNLSALTRLFLNGNPSMLFSDKERNKIWDSRTYLALLESQKKYTPQCPLATLFHAIISNKSVDEIQQAYNQLSWEMQERIVALARQDLNGSRSVQPTAASSSSDPSPNQDDLFVANLLYTIISNKPIEEIQQAYGLLSQEMQQQVADVASEDLNGSQSPQSTAASSSSSSSSSDPSPSQGDLFADMGLFARSVRKATDGLYDSLGLDQKNLVHYHIWDLAGRPETDDPQWGEHHAFDHGLRFVDALERAAMN
ncbi:MAG: leucine-rich repeat domain-containing protein, partial [Verrucomicrobia bacterium]|nr:leucine-rich repeat domain-containing protein [Verrucomicrobiota bacterium]